MKNLILLLKGMIIGVANIIPGVSGGTLMITLGLYEEIINVISHLFQNFKKNIKFILPIGIGIGLSILLLSKIISICLDKYPFPTTFFFVGLILGGIPLIWKKAKYSKHNFSNWLVFLFTFLVILLFAFFKDLEKVISLDNLNFINYLTLFLIGVISAATMVIPGISGAFVLMLTGYYTPIIDTIRSLTDFHLLAHNLLILIPFGIGIVVGIIVVAKLIDFFLKKYPIKTYYAVLGFVLASMISIVKPILNLSPSIIELIVACFLAVMGGFTAYHLGDR